MKYLVLCLAYSKLSVLRFCLLLDYLQLLCSLLLVPVGRNTAPTKKQIEKTQTTKTFWQNLYRPQSNS